MNAASEQPQNEVADDTAAQNDPDAEADGCEDGTGTDSGSHAKYETRLTELSSQLSEYTQKQELDAMSATGLSQTFDMSIDVEAIDEANDGSKAGDFSTLVSDMHGKLGEWEVAIATTQNLIQNKKDRTEPKIEASRNQNIFSISGIDQITRNLENLTFGMRYSLDIGVPVFGAASTQPQRQSELVSSAVRRHNQCRMQSILDYPHELVEADIPQYPMFEEPTMPNYLASTMPRPPSNRRPLALDIPSDYSPTKSFNSHRAATTTDRSHYSNEEIASTIQGLVETMSSKWSCDKSEAKKKLAGFIWSESTSNAKKSKDVLSPSTSTMAWDKTEETENEKEATKSGKRAMEDSSEDSEKGFSCMLLQDTELFSDPTKSNETTLTELPATSTVSIQKIQSINGKKYVKISAPQKGWISCRDAFDVPNLPL